MKEFKFWAVTANLKWLHPAFLLCIPALPYLSFFSFSSPEFFRANLFYISMSPVVCMILLAIFFFKKVRVRLTDDNRIAIFINGRMKHESSIDELKFIEGVNINKTNARSPLVMQLSEKRFLFNVLEIRGFPGILNQQIKFLMYMTEHYSLERERKGWNMLYMTYIYTYSNPNYKGY